MMNNMSGRVSDIFFSRGATHAAFGLAMELTLGVPDFVARQAPERFEIFGGSSFDNVLWQAWRWRGLVPVERLQIVAHELFVETRWALPDGILVLWPETRRIRGEAFVDQKQISSDRAELKFCICHDDAASRSMIATARINLQA